MGAFRSDYLKNKIADHVLGGPDYARPGTVYCALFTVAPTAAGGGTEVSGGAYARVSKANNSTNFPAAVAGLKHCATAIDFGTPTANWGNVVGGAWFDAASGGNMLGYADFDAPIEILSGVPFSIPANGATWLEEI